MPLNDATPVAFIGTPGHRRSGGWYGDKMGLTRVSADNIAAVFDRFRTMLRLSTITEGNAHPYTVVSWIVCKLNADMTALGRKMRFQNLSGVWPKPARPVACAQGRIADCRFFRSGWQTVEPHAVCLAKEQVARTVRMEIPMSCRSR